MKKKVLVSCIVGAPIGLAISFIITIIISLTVGDGNFYPVVPELIADCGSEINAVLLQTAGSMLCGAVYAAASFIWKKDNWSVLRQTITHLVVTSLGMFPVAYFMRWMPHNAVGMLIYFGIFVATYAIIWLSWYLTMKKRVRELNETIHRDKEEQ